MKERSLILIMFFLFGTIYSSYSYGFHYYWNLQNQVGVIQDLHFMPDNNQFILLAGVGGGSQIQIRNTMTGDTIRTYPIWIGDGAKLEFTPDSSRIIITNSDKGKFSLYKVKDMSFISSCSLYSDTITLWSTHIVVDPIRPYVYSTIYGEKTANNKTTIVGKVSVINYETMKIEKDLTSLDNFSYDALAVSPDGKYLATINYGDSYLKIWNLSNFSLVNNYHLVGNDYLKSPGQAKEMKFSQNNTDILYISGSFLNLAGTIGFDGIAKYSLSKNKLVDTTFRMLGNGHFELFDNEDRAINCNGLDISIINFKTNKTEFYYELVPYNTGDWVYPVYSKQLDIIIGSRSRQFSMGKFDRNTSVSSDQQASIVYPNPTSGIVNIINTCDDSNENYSIYDIKGNLIYQSKPITQITKNITIDFSTYSNGIYFVKVLCYHNLNTYKVVKG